jgi:hypothetical protein
MLPYCSVRADNAEYDNVRVKNAMEKLKKEYGYSFVFESSDVNTRKQISVSLTNASAGEAAKQILQGQEVSYEIRDKMIIVKRKSTVAEVPTSADTQQRKQITGLLVDEDGEPIIGANIIEKGSQNGTVTDADGNFRINVADNAILQISFIGYISQEISVLAVSWGGVNL